MLDDSFEMTTICPHCEQVNTMATKASGDNERPTPGAFSLCFTCGVFSAYAEDLSLRKLTEEEATHLLQDPEIINMIVGWREVTDPTNQKGTP
jgi:hypothetical protein